MTVPARRAIIAPWGRRSPHEATARASRPAPFQYARTRPCQLQTFSHAERLFRLVGRPDTPVSDRCAIRQGCLGRSALAAWRNAQARRDRALTGAPGSPASRRWSTAPRATPEVKASPPGFGRSECPPKSLKADLPAGAQRGCPSFPKTASRPAMPTAPRSGSRGRGRRSTASPAPGSFGASSIPPPASSSWRRRRCPAWPSASAPRPSTSRARTSSGATAASAAPSTSWSRSSASRPSRCCGSRPSCAEPTPRGSTWRRRRPGLLAASLGLSRMYADDLEQLEAGMLLYDAFYRWCRDATGETHNWPNKKVEA